MTQRALSVSQSTHFHTCMLCEAVCGVTIDVDNGKATRIRGDELDRFSRGHICPKAAALDDVRTDPDRVIFPMKRTARGFERVSWEEALSEAAERLGSIQEEHGKDAVGFYIGNPVAHSYAALLSSLVFHETLGTRARFSATSLDQLPHMLAALQMFGHQVLLPVPDIDRTMFLFAVGANPLVSNGSLMTAPDVAKRLDALRARGGKLVVVDPRRTETAKVADQHVFVRPGTDALLLLAMIHVIFREGLARLGRIESFTDGLGAIAAAAAHYPPESVSERAGVSADDIRKLARDFAAAPSAVCYTRIGACTQEFGGLAVWLGIVLTAITGNLDREGGYMFTRPAVDLVRAATMMGQKGSFGRWRSRVRSLPEFSGEYPVAALAEEIETPGEGQIRAMVTVAGNPALSAPNGARVARALDKLEYMVSVDVYKNETTRHANLILPAQFGLERDHYDVGLYAVAVRNVARYAKAIFPPAGETRSEWDILTELGARIASRRGADMRMRTSRALWGTVSKTLHRVGAKRTLDLLLRSGPYALSVAKLEAQPHGVDLGALVPRFPAALGSKKKRIDLAPRVYLEDLPRLRSSVHNARNGNGHLSLIGRRQLRSNNSWMHNSERLVKGRERCTLLIHPDDAKTRGLASGDRVTVESRVGAVTVPVEITDDVARGVVSLPHGWGHAQPGVELRVARAHAGASVNALTDETFLDGLSGNASFSGVPVTVTPA